MDYPYLSVKFLLSDIINIAIIVKTDIFFIDKNIDGIKPVSEAFILKMNAFNILFEELVSRLFR